MILNDGASFSDTQLGQFCGATRPGCKESSSNSLLVKFTSDATDETRGFSAKFYVGGVYEKNL